MTVQTEQNQTQIPTEQKVSDKELNFRALEQKYQQQLTAERAEKERLMNELNSKQQPAKIDEDEDDDEPYVDKKRLKKEQAKFGQQIKQETQSEIQKAVQKALYDERKQNWVKSNPDFYDIMQHAERIVQDDPELAESILEMPDTFERQKLVYRTIKSKGFHKPAEKPSAIQDKIDANRRSPYYQPSGLGAAPYNQSADYSDHGQKQAYEKMQALKRQLRL